MRLVLVGAGHVFDLRAAIRSILLQERPSVVALELDEDRLRGLLERRAGKKPEAADMKRHGRVYRALVKFQESVAQSYGAEPGGEMLAAVDGAQLVGARVVLIDRNAQGAVNDILKRMSLLEKVRFVWAGLVSSLPGRRKETIEAELQRYHADPSAYLEELGRQFPTIKRVLIDERNEHMAARLRALSGEANTVVAVVGDGHVPGLARLLEDLAPTIHRLRDLQKSAPRDWLQWTPPDGTSKIGFSFETTSPEGSLRRE